MERSSAIAPGPGALRDQTWTGPLATRFGVIGCLALLIAGALYYVHAYQRAGQYWIANTDYRVFYDAAKALRHHLDPYSATIAWMNQYNASHHIGTAFATKSYGYPPIFAVLQLPFSLFSVFQAAVLWDICNVLFLGCALYGLLRIAGIRPSPAGMLILITAAVLTDPIRKELFVAQADIFLLFLVCVALWLRYEDHPIPAGLLLGLACAIKPQLLLWVVFLTWKREFRFAVSAVLSCMLLFFVPFLWLGGHAWHDQLSIFSFWSNQYLAYDHNDSPKGVFVRLFTVNPVVRPLVVAPQLATVLWMLTSLVVLTLSLARISPCPLRRDIRSMLEIGLWVPAALLITPLTEWPYLLVLAIPLLSLWVWLRNGIVSQRIGRFVGAGAILVWIALCGPLTQIENHLVARMGTHSLLADIYVILAPGYLYALVAIFGLQMVALKSASGTTMLMSVKQLIGDVLALRPGRLRAAIAGSVEMK